jgi:hypothetical protein
MLSSVFAAAAGFLRRSATDPMRELMDRLGAITERAQTSTDPADADVLRQDLRKVAVEIATLGYERHSSYEQFAPVQLAFENTRDAVEALRARSRTAADLDGGAAPRAARTALQA